MLAAEGYRVTTAGAAGDAHAALERELPDLLIADAAMPDSDGRTFVEVVRADPPTGGLPILLLTALGDPLSTERGHRLAVDGYLVKPLARDQLFTAVTATLRRHADRRRPAPPAAADVVTTGIPAIDEQVGGLRPGRSYLAVTSAAHPLAEVLALQFLHEALIRDEAALLVTGARLDAVLYDADTAGVDLRPFVRSGRLVVLGLADQFARQLRTRDDAVALADELGAHARACGATRIVVSPILALLCASPRLPLSATMVADLIERLEQTGATTLVVSGPVATHAQALADAHVRHAVTGTIVVEPHPVHPHTQRLRLEGIPGADTVGRPVRAIAGVGLAVVDPLAQPAVFDRIAELRRHFEVETATAEDGRGGLSPLPDGGQRLRDPFLLYLRDCLAVAEQATAQTALVIARFAMQARAKGSLEPTAAVAQSDLDGVLAPQETPCWIYPGEIAVLVLGGNAAQARTLGERLRGHLEELAGRRDATLTAFAVATVAQPDDGTTADGLLDALSRAVARFGVVDEAVEPREVSA